MSFISLSQAPRLDPTPLRISTDPHSSPTIMSPNRTISGVPQALKGWTLEAGTLLFKSHRIPLIEFIKTHHRKLTDAPLVERYRVTLISVPSVWFDVWRWQCCRLSGHPFANRACDITALRFHGFIGFIGEVMIAFQVCDGNDCGPSFKIMTAFQGGLPIDPLSPRSYRISVCLP